MRQDLPSRSHNIGLEIDLCPRQIANILIAEAVWMRVDEIADGGLVFGAGAPALDIGRRALGERHRHAGGEAKEADRLTVSVMRMLRHLVEIDDDIIAQADLHRLLARLDCLVEKK